MQYKSLPAFTKEINGRSVTGVFAVHGNVDSYGDVSVNGSFSRRLADGSRKRMRFLWQHDYMSPPIASIREVREVSREDLPPKVLQYAPDATGGVMVTREYYEDVSLADWVLAGIRAGDIDEMSYAYDVHGYEYEERDGQQVRMLKDIEIFDISDVNWGANPATAGVKGMPVSSMPFTKHGDAVVSTVADYIERVKERAEFRAKEGRVLSGANRSRIKALVESLQEVTADLEQLLMDTEPKADPAVVLGLFAEYQRLEAQLLGAFS